ncbi:hypothetical protein XarbCFBP8152_09965 [Xanthomonas arboricola]|nr:hypothetical protein XarbCFBP8152_09965 [Xanthomonas arboricola]
MYARAEFLLDCAQQAEAALAGQVALDPATDTPSRKLSELERQRKSCARLGPGARVEAERLLRQAASQGDARAQVALLDQRADDVIGVLAKRSSADGVVRMSDAERAELRQIVGGLEQQAYRGNAAAMESLQQIMASGVVETSEPLYSAAWRLVAQQPRGTPLGAGPLKGAEMLDQLDARSEQQVVALARDLHAMCCAH